MKSKEKFLKQIKDGKWFLVKEKYVFFLVKMKSVTYPDIDTFIETLWLSNTDCESMCFSDYDSTSWDYKDNTFIQTASSVYHFGSPEGLVEESIYNEHWVLDVEKMKKTVLSYAKKDFITSSELDEVWEKIEQKNLDEFEILLLK
ncbi:hypothetical protein AB1283_00990 [Bacillus sp. S13(2024)]|uniref:hypothetical protein n=1 Tax=Bacillus sp. S13(2024) TaxID=3162885 RepID=UPI003D1C75C5